MKVKKNQIIKINLLGLTLLIIVLLVPSLSLAKGPVDMISIEQAELNQTILITDSKILNQFNPWNQSFIGDKLDNLPKINGNKYEVFFHLKDDQGKLQTRYEFDYIIDQERGYIYLPGPGDKWYDVNIGTIILSELDGHWYYASADWETVMKQVLNVGILPIINITEKGTPIVTPTPIKSPGFEFIITIMVIISIRKSRRKKKISDIMERTLDTKY